MAMTIGGDSQLKADLNLTPLIDVLLVLLIIFMVITPSISVGLNTLVPQPSDRPAPTDDIVVTVQGNGTVRLNQQVLDIEALGERLKAVFRSAPAQAIFVRADKDLDFGQVAAVIDIAKGAGLDRVALMPQR